MRTRSSPAGSRVERALGAEPGAVVAGEVEARAPTHSWSRVAAAR